MEIKLVGSDRKAVSLATVLRTPGHDFELAVGFLFGEGLIEQRSDVRQISFCQSKEAQRYQALSVHLAVPLPREALQRMRMVVTHGGCGACSMPSLVPQGATPADRCSELVLPSEWLRGLPAVLSGAMPGLAATGGVHAAALCEPAGQLEHIFEDVGRHNAVDKLIGHLVLQDRLPTGPKLLLLSGRAGFELLQKASRAGIQAVASLGAPTTLSVQWARRFNITLIGFLSDQRFNVYHGLVSESPEV